MRIIPSAVFATVCLALGATAAPAATLDRIKETGHIKLGYLADLRPFTYKSAAATPEGYGVALCDAVAARVKAQLAMPELSVDWVPVTIDGRTREVQQGNIDLLCAPMSITLTHRKELSFSIPVFAGGNRAVLRRDAPTTLRHIIAGTRPDKPVWRGSPAARILGDATYAVVAGSGTQRWLESRSAALGIHGKITPVPDYRTGLQMVRDRKADVFFGERSLVLGAMDDATRDELTIVNRLFTHEVAGLGLARGDEDFRLLVDASLSKLYASKEFADLYSKWFGAFDESERTFFLWNTLPE